jgi:hypothetical protein
MLNIVIRVRGILLSFVMASDFNFLCKDLLLQSLRIDHLIIMHKRRIGYRFGRKSKGKDPKQWYLESKERYNEIRLLKENQEEDILTRIRILRSKGRHCYQQIKM